jgi:hypothetical protein
VSVTQLHAFSITFTRRNSGRLWTWIPDRRLTNVSTDSSRERITQCSLIRKLIKNILPGTEFTTAPVESPPEPLRREEHSSGLYCEFPDSIDTSVLILEFLYGNSQQAL